MDLILWRHAQAEELPEGLSGPSGAFDAGRDLERKLTARGEKQAARMAEWLDRQLPGSARILSSPARRCEQTALALGRKFKVCPELAPGAQPEALLELVQWPLSKAPVLVIGHQPTLGQTLARLLGLVEDDCPIRKGAVWWLRTRERDGRLQAVVATVQSPELL